MNITFDNQNLFKRCTCQRCAKPYNLSIMEELLTILTSSIVSVTLLYMDNDILNWFSKDLQKEEGKGLASDVYALLDTLFNDGLLVPLTSDINVVESLSKNSKYETDTRLRQQLLFNLTRATVYLPLGCGPIISCCCGPDHEADIALGFHESITTIPRKKRPPYIRDIKDNLQIAECLDFGIILDSIANARGLESAPVYTRILTMDEGVAKTVSNLSKDTDKIKCSRFTHRDVENMDINEWMQKFLPEIKIEYLAGKGVTK